MTARTVSIVAAGYRPRNEGHLPGRNVARHAPAATTPSPFIAATVRPVTFPVLRPGTGAAPRTDETEVCERGSRPIQIQCRQGLGYSRLMQPDDAGAPAAPTIGGS